MRKQSYITFVAPYNKALKAFHLIGRSNDCDTKDDLQAIELVVGSPEYAVFKTELEKIGISYDERIIDSYSKEELAAAEFLSMLSGVDWGYPQPENSYERLCFDPQSRCPLCGNGARQIAPYGLRSVPKFRRGRELLMLNWEFEYIVSGRIADLIMKAGLKGSEFWPILSANRRRTLEGVRQLYVTHVLPRMSEKTDFPIVASESEVLANEGSASGNPSKCQCGRLGRNVPDVMIYNVCDKEKFYDFNKTYEWLGGGYRTYQIHVISNKVYGLLAQEQIADSVTLVPIRFDCQGSLKLGRV